MNNSPNPNKRRPNFNTQQRRGAKRQKLNPQNISTRGRGRMQRGRGHQRLLLRRGNTPIRGYRGRSRGSRGTRSRGRGYNNMMSNVHHQTQSPPKQSAAQLRAQLLKKAKASVSPQRAALTRTVSNESHNIISGTLTPEQIENQQRKKRLMQQRNVQKASTVTHVQTPAALDALRLQALKSMMHKTKPNNSNPAQINKAKPATIVIRKNAVQSQTHKLNPKAPVFKSNTNTVTKAGDANTQHIVPRNLKSYRVGAKHKDNISFTTTVFDINHNVAKTTISTNDSSSNEVAVTSVAMNKTSKLLPPKLDVIPPKIVSKIVVKKPAEVKKKEVCLALDAANWCCNMCTYHNEGNKSMKCSMCQTVNKVKKEIPNVSKSVAVEQKVKKTVSKIIPQQAVAVNTDKIPQVINESQANTKSVSNNVRSLEAAWKQREEAMKERQTDINMKVGSAPTQPEMIVDTVTAEPVIKSELQNDIQSTDDVDDNDIEMKQIIVNDTAQGEQKENVTEIKKVMAPKPVYPLPRLQECWNWDMNKKISDEALKGFIRETDEFMKEMDANLKIECKASSVKYRNAFDVEDNYLILDIVEDFEWTKNACSENNISWPANIDLHAFSKSVTQCNEW